MAAAADHCTKCKEPLDTEGYPLFCKACRAKYQREYQAMRKEMSESRGFCAGISAMRALLVREFNAQGSGSFTGYEIAGLIAQCSGPSADE